jgi:hypothetical protein
MLPSTSDASEMIVISAGALYWLFEAGDLMFTTGAELTEEVQLLVTFAVLRLSARPPEPDCSGFIAGLVYAIVTISPYIRGDESVNNTLAPDMATVLIDL